ncbi:MAG: sulfotransferase [Nanoarchaeota archaeon]
MSEIIPNFFIVGQPKCATTQLSVNLNLHPKIYFLDSYEPHYFAKDLMKEVDKNKGFIEKIINFNAVLNCRDLNVYLNLFNNNNNNKIVGEKSTNYLYSKVAAKEIYNFNPNAKILIILRSPKTFIPSFHSQCIKSSGEYLPLFDALKLENNRKKGFYLKNVKIPSILFYKERIKYTKQIKRFEKYFPSKQIKIIFFEDYKKDNQKIYNEIFEFLDIENIKIENNKNNHLRVEPKNNIYLYIYLFLNNNNFYFIPKKLIKRKYYIILRKYLYLLFFKQKPYQFDLKVDKFIEDISKDEVEKLEKYLKKNIKKKWNY